MVLINGIALFACVVTVALSQLQQSKEPIPHAEHSPGNPPPVGIAPPSPSANNTSAGGSTLTNASSPKGEPEPKPKGEPPSDHDHEHEQDHEHEHSPGNPKHLDQPGGGVDPVRGHWAHFLLASIPLVLTLLYL